MSAKERVSYDFNGVKHVQQGHRVRAITGEEFEIFQKLQTLEMEQDWPAVLGLCEAQIVKTPEWLTPYLCAGVACANLGRTEEAVRRLEYVQKTAEGNPLYSAAGRILLQLRMERKPPSPQ